MKLEDWAVITPDIVALHPRHPLCFLPLLETFAWISFMGRVVDLCLCLACSTGVLPARDSFHASGSVLPAPALTLR